MPPTCFATPDNGTTVFAGADAHAVQQAVDAAPAGSTVKVAGTCVGVENRPGTDQSVYIDKTLTLAGGYATSNWTTSQPLTQPTILDAAGAGRVIYASQDLTVKDMTLRNGNNTGAGGGLLAGAALVLSGVDVVSNTAVDANGGGVFATNGANVTGGTFRDNHCVGYCSGGALASDNGALVVSSARCSSTIRPASMAARCLARLPCRSPTPPSRATALSLARAEQWVSFVGPAA